MIITMDNHCNTNKHSEIEYTIKKEIEIPVVGSKPLGLLNIRAVIFLLLWYIFSGCTLFLNKYILTYMNGNPTLLGIEFVSIVSYFYDNITCFFDQEHAKC